MDSTGIYDAVYLRMHHEAQGLAALPCVAAGGSACCRRGVRVDQACERNELTCFYGSHGGQSGPVPGVLHLRFYGQALAQGDGVYSCADDRDGVGPSGDRTFPCERQHRNSAHEAFGVGKYCGYDGAGGPVLSDSFYHEPGVSAGEADQLFPPVSAVSDEPADAVLLGGLAECAWRREPLSAASPELCGFPAGGCGRSVADVPDALE